MLRIFTLNSVFKLPGAGILILLLLPVYSNTLSAQGRFSVSAGWGYYELANIGVRWNITERSTLALLGGTNFSVNDKKLVSTGLSFDHSFRNDLILNLKPGYSVGAYYWKSDDDLYYFYSMCFPAMLMLTCPVSESILLRAEGGGVLNAVLLSERKQNTEAGYPARVNGNIRFSAIFKLGAK